MYSVGIQWFDSFLFEIINLNQWLCYTLRVTIKFRQLILLSLPYIYNKVYIKILVFIHKYILEIRITLVKIEIT